ncbi:FAD-dependent oxidoreductase [Kitasatospora purpeofusca]|uniref:FAD-dependent oxidoreductase n=1 Tax=Kitasatospora purpeofusca TaxID=67352 RepID=UPI0022547329|nr:FAD-dependent oxidoreductase [Kitasatospora purpeofusca]MCX4757225.1 FAD-dependent oxidoreductase [Kitasatospora purpeofusca]WSR35020.1 FAD-dependent oxidoreductase [Kitasatospora purpeofusca]
MKTVIVGGVAAGASTGARLRRLDESAEIVILERGRFVSFANCGLPYHIGGAIPERDSLLLQTPESLARSLALDVRTGHEVLRIDRDAKEVEVRDLDAERTYRESYDTLVLCPGADPIRPPIPGADDPQVDVLRDVADMDRVITHLDESASRATVVGGSYIGLELAEALRSRGLETTIVERTDQLMPWLDHEMTRILHYHVRSHDVDVRLSTSAEAIHRGDKSTFTVDLSDGTTLEPDVLVLAAGARPNVELARDAGLEIGPRGGIVVDAHMRTSAPDILAAGDAVETPSLVTGEPMLSMLAGPANRQGRIAADTIAGRDSAYRSTQGTAVVKVFDMTAGGTGLTEAQLRAAGIDFRKVYAHPSGHAAYYPGTAPLFMKVLFDPAEGKLLGAQVLGWDGVDKRIDVLAVAQRAGMTVYDLEHLELAYAPPYGSAKDPVNMVGFLASNLLRGDIHLWYPEDFPQCAERALILDTRTRAEYDAWHIPGAVLIPYTELRERLDEVPRDKPVYTYCRSGFRSYIAYCVLRQGGWDTAFLSGGTMTYHGFHKTPLATGKAGQPVVTHAEDELAQRPGALTGI